MCPIIEGRTPDEAHITRRSCQGASARGNGHLDYEHLWPFDRSVDTPGRRVARVGRRRLVVVAHHRSMRASRCGDAAVRGAHVVVVAIERCSRGAASRRRVASLGTIAEIGVDADQIRHIRTHARDADLRSIAEIAIDTRVRVVVHVRAPENRVAHRIGARVVIEAARERGAGAAGSGFRIAGLQTIAYIVVVAGDGRTRPADALITHFDTVAQGFVRAVDVVDAPTGRAVADVDARAAAAELCTAAHLGTNRAVLTIADVDARRVNTRAAAERHASGPFDQGHDFDPAVRTEVA